jgi:hypothetical protein
MQAADLRDGDHLSFGGMTDTLILDEDGLYDPSHCIS